MRLPRVRVTVRRLMAVVVLAGVASGAITEVGRRRARFQTLANSHSLRAGFHIQRAQSKTQPFCGYGMSQREVEEKYTQSGIETLVDFKLSQYHWALAGKYEDAAIRPWLLVTPDPPEPNPK